MVEIANTDYGEVCLAVVCDGMGGLAKGELASKTLILAFEKWFQDTFPGIIYKGIAPEELKASWDNLIQDMNARITNYGMDNNVRLGTTIVALLIVGDTYYTLNVGDSRIYKLSETINRVTKDQTFIQREMDAGRMTFEEAMKSPQRNVLLQCVGASNVIEPAFKFGKVESGTSFILCSDGFRHVVSDEEIFNFLNPALATEEKTITEGMVYLTELNKYRREDDNISVVEVRVS
jgi:serine/threonine protein phosphatase PrpC